MNQRRSQWWCLEDVIYFEVAQGVKSLRDTDFKQLAVVGQQSNLHQPRCCAVEIHGSLDQFGAAANKLPLSTEEEDITLVHRVKKEEEVIQMADIKLTFVRCVLVG